MRSPLRARSSALILRAAAAVVVAGCFVHIPDLAPPDNAGADSGSREGGGPKPREAGGLAYREVVLADAPIAYWRFGEPSGTVATDASGHDHHAAYSGTCMLGVAGAIASDADTAVGFDGSVGSVSGLGSALDFSGRSAFSLEGWVKPARLDGGARRFFSREWATAAGRQSIGLALHPQLGLTFERYVDDAAHSVASPALAPGAFVHVVGTYDGNELLLYVDGALAGRAADTRETSQADVLFVMGGVDFEGVLDEVAVYDAALSPERVRAHHDAGVGR